MWFVFCGVMLLLVCVGFFVGCVVCVVGVVCFFVVSGVLVCVGVCVCVLCCVCVGGWMGGGME